MKNNRIFITSAMIIALTVASSLLFIFPIPLANGFVTLCEVGIYTGAFLLGPVQGFLIGGLSGGLIDFLSGFPQWIFFSFLIHGLQGFIAGYFFQKKGKLSLVIGYLLGSLTMIIGYFLATTLLYTWPAGVASLLGNLLQNLFGVFVSLLLIKSLQKIHFTIKKEELR